MITAKEARHISFNIKKDNILNDIETEIKDAAYKGLTEYVTDIPSASIIASDIVEVFTDLGYVVYNKLQHENGHPCYVLSISWEELGE